MSKPDDKEHGLYRKYEVRRLHDAEGKHTDCEYFVLDWKHDPFAIPAALAYADACAATHPQLAKSLRDLTASYALEHMPTPCLHLVQLEREPLKNHYADMARESLTIAVQLDEIVKITGNSNGADPVACVRHLQQRATEMVAEITKLYEERRARTDWYPPDVEREAAREPSVPREENVETTERMSAEQEEP